MGIVQQDAAEVWKVHRERARAAEQRSQLAADIEEFNLIVIAERRIAGLLIAAKNVEGHHSEPLIGLVADIRLGPIEGFVQVVHG